MLVGDRIRGIREEKNLSQGEIKKRGGLVRTYISRIEKATRFLRLRRWRSSPMRLGRRSTSCSTKARSRPDCLVFPTGRHQRGSTSIGRRENGEAKSASALNKTKHFLMGAPPLGLPIPISKPKFSKASRRLRLSNGSFVYSQVRRAGGSRVLSVPSSYNAV